MRKKRDRPYVNNAKYLAILLIFFGLILGGIYLATERIVVQKIVLGLVLPVGFLWLMLLTTSYFLIVNRRRGWGVFTLMLSVLFGLAGNGIISGYISRSLEAPFEDFDIDEAPQYDYVILLGGGTSYAINKTSQLGGSGDRVMVALHLYQMGKAKKILCTGSHIKTFGGDDRPSPGESAYEILTRAGVPGDAIEFVEGRNTKEEFDNLREYFKDMENPKVGVVSSAWHLPRVLRLAKRQDLKVDPLPANFMTEYPRFSMTSLIPSSGALHNNSKLMKEYLAKMLGQ